MQKLKWAMLVLALGTGAAGGYAYWRHQQRYPATDDAYLDAQVVRIASQIGGRITRRSKWCMCIRKRTVRWI